MNTNVQHIDQARHPPYKVGRGNTLAWRQDMVAANLEHQRRHGANAAHGGVAGWVLYAPWAHPVWPYHFLALLHLRELPGMPAAKILLPGATHEVLLMALDPGKTPDLVNPLASHLKPLNYTGQFISVDDNVARAKCERAVDEVLSQRMSPDTDYRGQWVHFFGHINRDADHDVSVKDGQHKVSPIVRRP
jgi:hypothetical protein